MMRAQQTEAGVPRTGLVTFILGLVCMAGLTGCVESGLAMLTDPLPRYSKPLDTPSNVIDRALTGCPQRTGNGEAQCVKKALADANVSITDLLTVLPQCRAGQVCQYGYTTHDQLGFIKAYAAELVVHWTVSLDLRHAGVAAAEVPITVTAVNQ